MIGLRQTTNPLLHEFIPVKSARWWNDGVTRGHGLMMSGVISLSNKPSMVTSGVKGQSCQCCGKTGRRYSWHHDVGCNHICLWVTSGTNLQDPRGTAPHQCHSASAYLIPRETPMWYSFSTRTTSTSVSVSIGHISRTGYNWI